MFTDITRLKNAANLGKEKVGGKAYALSEMMGAGFIIPDGFVIMADTLPADGKVSKALADAIDREFAILDCSHVAVRSSAIAEDAADASWAGQFATFLNVAQEDVIEKVQACFQSTSSSRVAWYAQYKNKVEDNYRIAVIVQAMVASETSGVAFSQHPVTADKDKIVIEAGLGLGETVVSGLITPDLYVVSKHTGAVLEQEISLQTKKLTTRGWAALNESGPKLSLAQIAELAAVVTELEAYYGYPVDVEWAFYEGRLYITQARPITTS